MVKRIHILKDSRGLGVQISMKLNHVTGEKGVFVSDISPGGAAARLMMFTVFLMMLVKHGFKICNAICTSFCPR